MKEKLSRVKDWLVFALSLEINIILTLFLFNVDIWSSIWQVARVNVAVLFFYGWLWFIDLYLNNYSAAAVEEKRRLAKEGIYNPGPVVFEKKVKPEPLPKPVYVKPQAEVVYEQPKAQPVVEQPQVVQVPLAKPRPVSEEPQYVASPLAKPHPASEEPQYVEVSVGETVNIQTVVQLQPEPTVQPVVEEVKPVVSNREQLLAWIQEEENKGRE